MKALVLFLSAFSVLTFAFVLRTIPGGVDVYLDGDYIGNTGEDGILKIDASSGVLKLTKPGYWTVSFEMTGDGTQIRLFLSTRAFIVTEPSGAELYVDGFFLGTSPYRGEAPSGKHVLRAVLDGYGEVKKEVNFDLNKENDVKLELVRYGTVRIETNITADLKIDGEDVGKSPVEIVLEPGKHEIEFYVEGKLVRTEYVKVSKDQPYTILKYDLPRVYSVKIETVPSGASVRIDDEKFTSPVFLKLVEGEHRIVIEKRGYEKIEKILRIPEDGTDFKYSLKEILVDLTVESTPNSKVFLDGEYIGITPLSRRVPLGFHRIYLVSESGERWFDTFRIEEDTKIEIDMRKRATLILLGKAKFKIDGVLFIPPVIIHPLMGEHGITIETEVSTSTLSLDIRSGDIVVISDDPSEGALIVEADEGVEVYINGLEVKPGELIPVPEGDVEIKLQKGGNIVRDHVKVHRGELKIYRKGMLEFRKILVDVITVPAGCELSIDDHGYGETPQRVLLLPGFHRFVFKCGSKIFEKSVKIEEGTRKLTFDLEVDGI